MFQSKEPAPPAILRWWYWLFAPRFPATFQLEHRRHELERRGQTVSLIIGIALFGAVLGFLDDNTTPLRIGIIGVGSLILSSMLLVNRSGRIGLASLVVVFTVHTGLYTNIFLAAQQDVSTLLTVLIVAAQAPIFTVSLLASPLVFVSSFINISIVVACVLSGALPFNLAAAPVILYLITSLVAYVWVNGERHAILRADLLDQEVQIATKLADEKMKQAREKNREALQIEHGVARIMQAITVITDSPEQPIGRCEDDTWVCPVLGALEDLRCRLHAGRETEDQYRSLLNALYSLNALLTQHRSLQGWRETRTPVDEVVRLLKRQLARKVSHGDYA